MTAGDDSGGAQVMSQAAVMTQGLQADRNKRGETHTVMHNSFLLRGLPSSCHLINASFPPLPASLLSLLLSQTHHLPSLPNTSPLSFPLLLLLFPPCLFSTFLPSFQVILPPISTLHYTSEFPTSISFSISLRGLLYSSSSFPTSLPPTQPYLPTQA